MKKRISFTITIGSRFVEGEMFPVGGAWDPDYVVEFECTDESKMFTQACEALTKKLGRTDYHIWYWDWLKGVE